MNQSEGAVGSEMLPQFMTPVKCADMMRGRGVREAVMVVGGEE